MKHIALRSHDGSSVVSSIIANGTYGEVNHSSIEFVEDGIVVEAHIKQGVIIRPVSTDAPKDVVHRFVFEVSDEDYATAFQFAQDQKGKKYDNRSIIRFIPGVRRLVRADREATARWICSELAEVIMRKANIPTVSRSIKAETVSPQDQFKSIRCDVTERFGPVRYDLIHAGVLRGTLHRAA